MFRFDDPEKLMKENIGLINVVAREYDRRYAKKEGICPRTRYDGVIYIPQLYTTKIV